MWKTTLCFYFKVYTTYLKTKVTQYDSHLGQKEKQKQNKELRMKSCLVQEKMSLGLEIPSHQCFSTVFPFLYKALSSDINS